MTLTQEIAKRIHAITFDTLPDEAIPLARTAMLDAVACAFAGAPEETVRILERIPGYGAEGPCAVFGRGYRTNPLDAVLVNGTAMHALDFDDMSITLGGHPTAMLTPVIFALGDMLEISGKDAILAYVIGFETETRIARGVHMHHYDKGWHPTATLGVFGAAAAASHLLGLTEAQTATALGISASLASGLKANFGSDTKPLHVGHGNRNGLFAALLAKEGFTANDAALEHKQGFLNVYNGEGHYDIDKILDGWGEPFDLVSVGVGLKKHPCCGGTHPPIEAMLNLRADNDINPDQVERIEVLVHPLRLPHTNNPEPKTPLQGKFSQQYCAARALLDGRLKIAHFQEAALAEPAVQKLLKKVKASVHPKMSMDFQPYHSAEVIVTMKDGTKLSDYNAVDLGRGLSNPMTDAELWEKFEDCAQCSLEVDAIQPAFDSLQSLETAANIRDVTELMLRPKAAGKKVPRRSK